MEFVDAHLKMNPYWSRLFDDICCPMCCRTNGPPAMVVHRNEDGSARRSSAPPRMEQEACHALRPLCLGAKHSTKRTPQPATRVFFLSSPCKPNFYGSRSELHKKSCCESKHNSRTSILSSNSCGSSIQAARKNTLVSVGERE